MHFHVLSSYYYIHSLLCCRAERRESQSATIAIRHAALDSGGVCFFFTITASTLHSVDTASSSYHLLRSDKRMRDKSQLKCE